MTPLLEAVSEKKGRVVKYLINECEVDITKLDQVILYRCGYSWVFGFYQNCLHIVSATNKDQELINCF